MDDSLALFVFSIDSAQFRICENLSLGAASELNLTGNRKPQFIIDKGFQTENDGLALFQKKNAKSVPFPSCSSAF